MTVLVKPYYILYNYILVMKTIRKRSKKKENIAGKKTRKNMVIKGFHTINTYKELSESTNSATIWKVFKTQLEEPKKQLVFFLKYDRTKIDDGTEKQNAVSIDDIYNILKRFIGDPKYTIRFTNY